ncbi:MAG: hypothetical protein ABW046_07155 [Actinoplanes sp.]
MQPQPQYPAQPAAPQYPQQPQTYPQPAYPQQPPAYPQQPQGYPQQPQAYAPPMPQQGYPQAYAQPQYAPPAPPAAPLPAVSLDAYWQEPSSSNGPSLKWKDTNDVPQIGKSYEGFIAREIRDSDIRPQTDKQGQPTFYRDGRPKSVMVVPLIGVQPAQEFQDGQAGWWVKGQGRDELARAMAEVGAPQGAPEAGAWVRVTLVGARPIPGYSAALQFRVEYRRPQGVPQSVPAAAHAPAQVAPMQQTAPVMSTATGQPQIYQQPVPPAPAPQPVPQQAPVPQPVSQPLQQPAAAAPGQGAAPAGFTAEQQALFAKLTGQPAS